MKYSEFEAFRKPDIEETLENPVLERVPKVQGRTGRISQAKGQSMSK